LGVGPKGSHRAVECLLLTRKRPLGCLTTKIGHTVCFCTSKNPGPSYGQFSMDLISVKIPKTGTSTLGGYLNASFGRQVAVPLETTPTYDGQSILYHDREKAQAELREYAGLLCGQRYINIHLPVWSWDGLWPGVPRICFVRRPETWVISCYFFALSLQHIPESMTIFEYMEIPYRQNWQAWYMDYDIDNFDFIGFQETFNGDVIRLFEFLERPFPGYQESLNVAVDPIYKAERERLLGDTEYLNMVKRIYQADNDLYWQAWNKFKTP